MKVQNNGKTGFRWGQHGHVYYGPGAQAKAALQGRAAYAAGYRAEKKKWHEHFLFVGHEQKRTANDAGHPSLDANSW